MALPEPTELADEALETEVCTLAGHLAAATCRWLLLLAEMDRRRSWAGIGMTGAAAHVERIDAGTTLPRWLGETLNLPDAVSAVLLHRDHLRQRAPQAAA